MKLQEILEKLKGTDNEPLIKEINSAVDEIKAKAVKNSQDALESLKKEKTELTKELQPLKEKAANEKIFNEFIKAGGNPTASLKDYKLDAYLDEKTKKHNWEKFFETHKHLKKDPADHTLENQEKNLNAAHKLQNKENLATQINPHESHIEDNL